MFKRFLRLRKFIEGRSLSDETLFTTVVLSPLSSLPRDGGDARGGSFDFLVAAFAALGSLRLESVPGCLLAACLLSELCYCGHSDSAFLILRPELGLASIRRWGSRDSKLPGIVNLARAFKVEGF